jgi:hypothetical protein
MWSVSGVGFKKKKTSVVLLHNHQKISVAAQLAADGKEGL